MTTIDSPTRRDLLRACGALGTALLAGPLAWSQVSASLRPVVGFPAGGTADALAGVLAPAMASGDVAVMVENKPGATGQLAAALAKHRRRQRAARDTFP